MVSEKKKKKQSLDWGAGPFENRQILIAYHLNLVVVSIPTFAILSVLEPKVPENTRSVKLCFALGLLKLRKLQNPTIPKVP
jgi:hypothetical protein